MKTRYLTIQICKNNKWYARMLPVSENENIDEIIKSIPDYVCADIFTSKKAARAAVAHWNGTFKQAGIYLKGGK